MHEQNIKAKNSGHDAKFWVLNDLFVVCRLAKMNFFNFNQSLQT